MIPLRHNIVNTKASSEELAFWLKSVFK